MGSRPVARSSPLPSSGVGAGGGGVLQASILKVTGVTFGLGSCDVSVALYEPTERWSTVTLYAPVVSCPSDFDVFVGPVTFTFQESLLASVTLPLNVAAPPAPVLSHDAVTLIVPLHA